MYVRQPNQNGAAPSRVKLPDNYGGSAFSQQYYNDMPPPARQSAPPKSDYGAKLPPPTVDLPPKSSPLAEQLRNAQVDYTQEREEIPTPLIPRDTDADYSDIDTQKESNDSHDAQSNTRRESPAPSLLSSLIPKGSVSGNFPFGHGIGGEELLILGIMLLVYLSGAERGEIDGEFIILLGLLLFAG